MFVVLILLLCCCGLQGQTIDLEDRITNGTACNITNRPYLMAVLTSTESGVYLCGGTLISSDWIVTAAHCVFPELVTKGYTLLYGGGEELLSKWGQHNEAIKGFRHPEYNNETKYDIGVVQSKHRFKLGKSVDTVRLPTRKNFYESCKTSAVQGWGRVNENVTIEPSATLACGFVNLVPLTEKDCTVAFSGNYTLRNNDRLDTIDNSYIFAVTADDRQSICFGDTGGPLICRGVFIGVGIGLNKVCGTPGSCQAFVNLETTFDFINDHTGIELPYLRKTTERSANSRATSKSGNVHIWCLVIVALQHVEFI